MFNALMTACVDLNVGMILCSQTHGIVRQSFNSVTKYSFNIFLYDYVSCHMRMLCNKAHVGTRSF